jgi:hypothetical protein
VYVVFPMISRSTFTKLLFSISAMTNLDSNQVARRLNEMQKIGLIKLTGKTVKSDSGRSEREWTA